MKSLVEKINESLLFEAGKDDYDFTYRSQLDFGKYFKKRAKQDGYKMLLKGRYKFMDKPWAIDNIYVYDAYPEHTVNIPNVKADGSLTFDEAYNKIVEYYKTNYPDWF